MVKGEKLLFFRVLGVITLLFLANAGLIFYNNESFSHGLTGFSIKEDVQEIYTQMQGYSKILLIARHKDLSVMFISQNSSNLEINAIRQADYLLLKPSSLLQKDFERKKIKQIYEEAQENFEDLKGTEGLTYVYADKFRGFVTNKLPSFWSEKVSKGYSKR